MSERFFLFLVGVYILVALYIEIPYLIYGLVAFAGLILAGCSGLLFNRIAILPVLVTIYVVAAIAIGRRRRRATPT